MYKTATNGLHTISENECLDAVKKDGMTIRFVKKQTDLLCNEAIKNNCFAIQYIRNKTEDLCLLAVKKIGFTLQYIMPQKNMSRGYQKE